MFLSPNKKTTLPGGCWFGFLIFSLLDFLSLFDARLF